MNQFWRLWTRLLFGCSYSDLTHAEVFRCTGTGPGLAWRVTGCPVRLGLLPERQKAPQPGSPSAVTRDDVWCAMVCYVPSVENSV